MPQFLKSLRKLNKGDTSRFIQWGQHYVIPQPRITHDKDIKLQTNISYWQRFKTYEQSVSKPDLKIYKKENTSWSSGFNLEIKEWLAIENQSM